MAHAPVFRFLEKIVVMVLLALTKARDGMQARGGQAVDWLRKRGENARGLPFATDFEGWIDRQRLMKPSPLRSFALAAVRELRKAARAAAEAPGIREPFLTTLSPLLLDVELRLKEVPQAKSPESSDVEKRIHQLVVVLERLARWPCELKPFPSSPFNRRNYPFLDRLVNGIQQAVKTNIRRLAKSTHERAPLEREKFQKSFRAFSNTERIDRGPSLSDLIMTSTGPVGCDDYTAHLRLLHETLCRCSPQADGCGGSFMANVALTRVEKLEATNDNVQFDFFFLHRHPDSEDDMWKEARIRVFQGQRSAPRVKWQDSEKSSEKSSPEPISPKDFCDLIRHRAYGRLVLNAAREGLIYERAELSPEQLERCFQLEESSVSLATVLNKQKLHGDVRLKLLLSYLLAKAIWEFYDSDWMASSWSKDTIHFMRELESSSDPQEIIITLIHKPYFATELSPPPTRPGEASQTECSTGQGFMQRFSSATHSHPKILALGILLLEIELEKSIELYRRAESRDDKNPIENEDHFTAGTIIVSPEWKRRNVFQAVKEVIEICLKPDTNKFHVSEVSARDALYTYVVAPLGQLFKQAWSRDSDPESFSPEPISFKATDFSPDSPAQAPAFTLTTRLSSAPVVPQTPMSPRQGLRRAETEITNTENGSLLGDKDDEHTARYRQIKTDEWFSRFQELLVTHGLLGRGREERIKVAILDSGINIGHYNLSPDDCSRIKASVSFVDSDAEVDEADHGTHLAAIILRLTKNVDLYIGKITTASSVEKREKIAEALKVARTEWGVHMITLSFGFDSVSSPDTMGDEIRECLHHGIMIFASASNDGGEGSRTYPAKYPGVVCAHSATWRGSKAERNPGLEKGLNFSFVGEYVRPTWSSTHSSGDGRVAYRSGTSYAAPVAVSVAAFMIGYIRKKMPNVKWVIKPWSPEGILKIFELMSVKIDGYDWVSPTRYMVHTKKEKIEGDLLQFLA
ncbi:hypothetical protein F4802DRAFT_619006 [Xylaria palmicola]|nr:hypothetical protein F4802DRAFT_619006 [Xylaria palmicola]